MQTLGLVPSDAIQFCFGLFCSGNFVFGEKQRQALAEAHGFDWDQVRKINIKEALMLHLNNGEIKTIPLADLAAIRRYACRFCPDYAAEFADIAFGGIGAREGWTTTIMRTPLGRAVFSDARSAGALETFRYQDDHRYASAALEKVHEWSRRKKESAAAFRQELGAPSVRVKI
jgi:coenzyme F420 hydrogenase subunit beta